MRKNTKTFRCVNPKCRRFMRSYKLTSAKATCRACEKEMKEQTKVTISWSPYHNEIIGITECTFIKVRRDRILGPWMAEFQINGHPGGAYMLIEGCKDAKEVMAECKKHIDGAEMEASVLKEYLDLKLN